MASFLGADGGGRGPADAGGGQGEPAGVLPAWEVLILGLGQEASAGSERGLYHSNHPGSLPDSL